MKIIRNVYVLGKMLHTCRPIVWDESNENIRKFDRSSCLRFVACFIAGFRRIFNSQSTLFLENCRCSQIVHNNWKSNAVNLRDENKNRLSRAVITNSFKNLVTRVKIKFYSFVEWVPTSDWFDDCARAHVDDYLEKWTRASVIIVRRTKAVFCFYLSQVFSFSSGIF